MRIASAGVNRRGSSGTCLPCSCRPLVSWQAFGSQPSATSARRWRCGPRRSSGGLPGRCSRSSSSLPARTRGSDDARTRDQPSTPVRQTDACPECGATGGGHDVWCDAGNTEESEPSGARSGRLTPRRIPGAIRGATGRRTLPDGFSALRAPMRPAGRLEPPAVGVERVAHRPTSSGPRGRPPRARGRPPSPRRTATARRGRGRTGSSPRPSARARTGASRGVRAAGRPCLSSRSCVVARGARLDPLRLGGDGDEFLR
jgi:hypothetical protein